MNQTWRTSWKISVLACVSVVAAVLLLALPATAGYVQTNLVSDIPGLAAHIDPDLVNPWGITSSPTSPFWVSDNGMGLATLYNGAGVKQGLVVTIPGAGNPTGVVFNGTSAFNGDRFVFAAEDGTIAGWRPALGTTAETLVSPSDAVYKGLALANVAGNSYLYATNFFSGAIDVFHDAGAPNLSGNFTDPNLPAGYAPFGIRNLGDKLYVTYAQQDAAKHDDVAGAGHGFVDVFNLDGSLVGRLISRGQLNSPWGLALAPDNFGEFSKDLLVGNFGDGSSGDGSINAFDPATGNFLGPLTDKDGKPIFIDGLWGLTFGNGGAGGATDTLFFTAGLDGEQHGLFGSIAVPVPPTFVLLGSGLAGLLTFARARKKRA
jgi:uncharacterized protein (TIGR03118 family)